MRGLLVTFLLTIYAGTASAGQFSCRLPKSCGANMSLATINLVDADSGVFSVSCIAIGGAKRIELSFELAGWSIGDEVSLLAPGANQKIRCTTLGQ